MRKPKRRTRFVAPFEKIEVEYFQVREEEYEQILDEWTDLVYSYFCQLSEKKILAPELLTPLAAERTGTDA